MGSVSFPGPKGIMIRVGYRHFLLKWINALSPCVCQYVVYHDMMSHVFASQLGFLSQSAFISLMPQHNMFTSTYLCL